MNRSHMNTRTQTCNEKGKKKKNNKRTNTNFKKDKRKM